MKIKLSKSQWELVGKKAGWMKTSQAIPINPSGNSNPYANQTKTDNPYKQNVQYGQPQQQQPPQQNQFSLSKDTVPASYNDLIQKFPAVQNTVSWLTKALANKSNITPDVEKQIRAQQTNLKVSLEKMGFNWKQVPELLSVLQM